MLTFYSNIFLGFALDKIANYVDAESAYVAATKVKDADPQAWQGLVKIYERQGCSKLDEYQAAALRLAQIFQSLDDKYKCQDVIDKFQDFAKTRGTRLQHKKALDLLLPTSPIYEYLEGRVPQPSHTYQLIAQITEFDENERVNKEIGERRTRLGSKIGQVTLDVKREVFQNSDLEALYAKIIDWSNDDEVRRQYEEKLLRRCVEALETLPAGKKKDEKRQKVLKLASDMVIIKHPFKLAWDIAIEWRDPKGIEDYDANILREYVAFFENSGLANVLQGFMSSDISPFPRISPPLRLHQDQRFSDESEDDEDGGVNLKDHMTPEERLLLMSEGIADCPQSILAHRLMGEYYQYLDEHESIVELIRNGRRLLDDEKDRTGMEFKNVSTAFTGLLGTALVFYQSPKNHPEAKALFDDLLIRDPTSGPALIGIGLIYEEEEDYPAAFDALGRALEGSPKNIRVKVEYSWVKAVVSHYTKGMDDLKACLPFIRPKDLQSKYLLALTRYRIGLCLWNLDKSKQARKDRNGAYSFFLEALKSDLNFAPAYSILGTYYADYAKDSKRARKCFQKAFELSSSEVGSAERLAKELAALGDWEAVEAVAQRVVDSGKVRPAPGSKKKGISWPYAALGVSELNRQDYAKSIVSFQAALRIKPHDYHSWVGLGESYHNLGRFIAATRAFKHAEQFEKDVQQKQSGETWFAKHMLGNVKRELGDYDDAIEEYRAVLKERPDEFGAAMALIQGLVEGARDSIAKGLLGKATSLACETILSASAVVESRSDSFNLWKSTGDACMVFTSVQGRIHQFPYQMVSKLLQHGDIEHAYTLFSEIDNVGLDSISEDNMQSSQLGVCLHAAILHYKRAIVASAHDTHAQAVAYYNMGWAEHRAHFCLSADLKKRPTRYVKAAVRCFKRAIELEARNAEFWNSLGVATSELNPQIAQHSFIRSLYLNERSAPVWTNLATLYLLQNDLQLATEAFRRAQSADPDFSHAWLGQAFVALLSGDRKEADILFMHAMNMSESSSSLTKEQYTRSIFDQILSSSTIKSVTDLVQPIFALRQLQSMTPDDLTSQHLLALFSERIDDITSNIELLSQICTRVEADYEDTEAPTSLFRFALSKTDLARSQVAARYYEDAIENGETAIQLSAEDAGNEQSLEARQKCRLSAHLTIGLAQYYQGNIEAALEYFQPALEESNNHPDAVCLLTRVLWAQGDDSSRTKARDLLYSCIESHPGHVQSVLLLGIITLLDNDAEGIEAVTSELQALRPSENITDMEQDQLDEVLRAIASISAGDAKSGVLMELQTSVLLRPQQPEGWARLAGAADDEKCAEGAAEMALATALRAVPSGGEMDAVSLAGMFAGTGKAGNAQRAVALAPWRREGWDVLAGVVDV